MAKLVFLIFAVILSTALAQQWTTLGGSLSASSYPAVILRQGVYHVFARGGDNTLQYGKFNSGTLSQIGTWRNLGGALGSSPTDAVIKNGNEIHVFALDQSSTTPSIIWINSTDAGTTWSPWGTVVGSNPYGKIKPGDAPTAAGTWMNHVPLIFRLSDGRPMRLYYAAKWYPLSLGKNAFSSSLVLQAWNNETATELLNRHFDLFGIGTDGTVYQNMWDFSAGGWLSVMTNTGLTGVNGAAVFTSADPSVYSGKVITQESRVRVFVAALDGSLYEATQTWTNRNSFIGQSNWHLVNGVSLGGTDTLCRRPVAVSSSSGLVRVFSISSQGILLATSFQA